MCIRDSAYILDHSEAKVLVVDRQLHVEVKKALSTLKKKIIIIDINDKFADQSKCEKIGELEYESFLNSGGKNFDTVPCLNDNNDHINLLEKLITKAL